MPICMVEAYFAQGPSGSQTAGPEPAWSPRRTAALLSRALLGSGGGEPLEPSGDGPFPARAPGVGPVGADSTAGQVGGQTILEYWIPAENLDDLDANIAGRVAVVVEFWCGGTSVSCAHE